MKAINLLKTYWKEILFVVALFGYGGNEVSKILQDNNDLYTSINEAAIIKYPKGSLTAYRIDIMYTMEQGTTGDGVPSSMYNRDFVIQNKYLVLPGAAPTTNAVEKEIGSPIQGFKVNHIFNIREVTVVREHKESLEPKEPEDE